VKLPRAVFRYIEHELYNYQLTKRELEELRRDIISIAASPGWVAANGTGVRDTTGGKAVRLVTNAAIARMTRTVAAIDRALVRLSGHHRWLFELKYCQGMSWQRICAEMHIEERTYYKYRRELVIMVALEMGLISHAEIVQS